jgi:chemotaxis signal transduction protein
MNNGEALPLSQRAAALRQSFDQAFAQAPAGAAASSQAFLAVGIGGDDYALRLSDVTELYVDKKVVPLSSHSPDLLGIASFRGVLVPIFDLRLLLGYSASAWPRWLVLTQLDLSVGLAFDRLDGYLTVTSDAVVPAAETRRKHLAEAVSADGLARPVIDVASIVNSIGAQLQSSSSGPAG